MNPNFFSKIPKSPDSPSGFLLYGEYTPIEILGEGGMGRVFLVRSLLTEQRFALKCAKYSTDSDRKSFLAELQTWIDIPEHPNIVACRFFRTMIDDIVIFADYVEQGSLKDWIDSKQLYKGSSQDALERILGIAIQSAWALYCLHEIGAVHQDVKPANILMSITHDAGAYTLTPQITDFGLTRARARAGERYEPNGNIYNSSIRGTRAYWGGIFLSVKSLESQWAG